MNAPTTKVANNIEFGMVADVFGGDYTAVASENPFPYEEVFTGYDAEGNETYQLVETPAYRISFHKGLMPAHEVQGFETLQELANAMRDLQDLRKWRIQD